MDDQQVSRRSLDDAAHRSVELDPAAPSALTPDERAVHAKALEAIQGGRLPRRRPNCIWGGAGQGYACAICGQSVGRHETELELEFLDDRATGVRAGSEIRVHAGCFAAWEFQLRRLEQPALPDGDVCDTVARRGADGTNGREST